jgi:hypothetical protein
MNERGSAKRTPLFYALECPIRFDYNEKHERII